MLRMLPFLLALAACATPQERCINDAAAPYRAALKERAEIYQGLAKGFVYKTEYERRRIFTRCRVGKHRYVSCYDWETVPVTRRVPVDRDALKERDAQLAQDLPGLERAANRGTQACVDAFANEAE